MKILMVVGNYFPQSCGGTEVFTQLLAEGLVRRGHSIAVLCIGERDSDEVIHEVRVYRRRVCNIVINKNSRLVKWINQSLHLYNPFNKRLVKEIIKKEETEILHLQMARTLSFSVLQAAHECQVATTHTLHELFSMWSFNAYMHDCVEKIHSKPTFLVNLFRGLHKRISAHVDTSPLHRNLRSAPISTMDTTPTFPVE